MGGRSRSAPAVESCQCGTMTLSEAAAARLTEEEEVQRQWRAKLMEPVCRRCPAGEDVEESTITSVGIVKSLGCSLQQPSRARVSQLARTRLAASRKVRRTSERSHESTTAKPCANQYHRSPRPSEQNNRSAVFCLRVFRSRPQSPTAAMDASAPALPKP